MSVPTHTASCENCGKRVLPTDTLCWHCGYKLTPQVQPVDLTLNPRTRAGDPPPAAPSYDLRAIAVYGGLTLVIILALLLVMRALGQQPLLVSSAGLDTATDWIRLTDSQLRYTLGVPAGWQWLDVPFRDQQAVLADMIDRQPATRRALDPLGQTAGDLTIEGVAVGTQALQLPDPVPFVVIATSPRLRDLAPEEALALLTDSQPPASDQRVDTSVPLQPRARFTVLDGPPGFQCHHLVTADPATAAYLVAACAPQAQFDARQGDLMTILDSFQLLQP